MSASLTDSVLSRTRLNYEWLEDDPLKVHRQVIVVSAHRAAAILTTIGLWMLPSGGDR